MTRFEGLENLGPMSLPNSLRLKLGEQGVNLNQVPENILDMFKSRILSHSARHLSSANNLILKFLTNLSGNHRSPRSIPKLVKLLPDTRQRKPDRFEVLNFLKNSAKCVIGTCSKFESFFGLGYH
jgi:hypothetical protein